MTTVEESKPLLIWTNTGNEVLEESTDLINWTPMSDATSPMLIDPLAAGGGKFYRLVTRTP